MVACALLALDERGRDRLIAQLGAEAGGTLRRLLASRGERRATARPSPGAAKIRQEWEKAWDEWEACVAESQDEHGRYVVREHHWEEPYLDGSSVAEDLEPIAARMRTILGRVIDPVTLTLPVTPAAQSCPEARPLRRHLSAQLTGPERLTARLAPAFARPRLGGAPLCLRMLAQKRRRAREERRSC